MDLIKIADMELNTRGVAPLVVSKVSARKTRRGSDYLALEFFDGSDHINGNYWDWGGVNIPKVNTILDVTYSVTEYNGNKQLTIAALKVNTDLDLTAFMPKPTGLSIDDVYDEAIQLIEAIQNEFLYNICKFALVNYRSAWLAIPGAKTMHHAFVGGTLVHSLSVARIAQSIAINIDSANIDLTVAGALLHDLGKLDTYELNGVIIDMTDRGKLFDHLYMGAIMVQDICKELYPDGLDRQQQRILDLLTHIILSHHGEKEYGSTVNPETIEAHIVYHADTIDAVTEMISECSNNGGYMWTDRIWALHNVPHVMPSYTGALFES